MWSWLRFSGLMTSMTCAILVVFCCVSCTLAGGFSGANVGFARYYHERGQGATYFSNLALLGTFVTGSIAISRSDARMGRAAAGLFASSLLVPLLVVYIPYRIAVRAGERKMKAEREALEKALREETPEIRAKREAEEKVAGKQYFDERKKRMAELEVEEKKRTVGAWTPEWGHMRKLELRADAAARAGSVDLARLRRADYEEIREDYEREAKKKALRGW